MAEPARIEEDDRPQLEALEGGGEATGGSGDLRLVDKGTGTYDRNDEAPVTAPQLEALEGGGEATGVRKGHLKDVSKGTQADSEGDEDRLGKGYTGNKSAQRGSVATSAASFMSKPSLSGFIKLAKRNKGKTAGISFALTLVIVIAIGFIVLVPFKIMHIMENLHARSYATSENAMERQMDRLFTNYMLKKVRVGNLCTGGYIDHTCNPFKHGDSLITHLYNGWSRGKLEKQLWEKNGFRVIKSGAGYSMQFKDPITGKELYKKALGGEFMDGSKTFDDIIKADGRIDNLTRQQVRQIFRTALDGETRYKSVNKRIKISRLLAKKYGIRYCVIGCKVKDKYDDWKDSQNRSTKRLAAKYFLTDRVLTPRGELLSLILQCIYTAPDGCSKEKVLNTEPSEHQVEKDGCKLGCDVNGRPYSEKDSEIEAKILALAAQYKLNAKDLEKQWDKIEKEGFIRSVFLNALDQLKTNGDTKGKEIDKIDWIIKQMGEKLPVIGWILFGANIVDLLNSAPQVIPKMMYIANTTAAVSTYMMYQTTVSEQKEGHVDADIYGSFVNSLGAGQQPGGGGKQIGGDAGAETTPLYQLVNNTRGEETKFSNKFSPFALSNPFTTKASAAGETQSPPEYKCATSKFASLDDDKNDSVSLKEKSFASGSKNGVVCDEEVLNNSSDFLKRLKELQNNDLWELVADIAHGIVVLYQNVVEKIIAIFANICSLIPGCTSIVSYFADALSFLFNQLLGFIAEIPGIKNFLKMVIGLFLGPTVNFVSSNMSGGRTYDVIAAGADVAGNDYAHDGLGGRVLKPGEVKAIALEQATERYEQYANQSFFARMFDTESEYSPITRFALSMPSNRTGAVNNTLHSMYAIIANPLHTLGSIFNLQHAYAANTLPTKVIDDPFGIPQYGYPLNDPILNKMKDPEEFWNKYCVSTSPDYISKYYNIYASDITDNLDDAAKESLAGKYSYMPTNLAPGAFESDAANQIRTILGSDWTGTNPCLLLQATAGSAGAIYTDDVLTPDEKSSSSGGSTGDIPSGPIPTGTASELAQKLLTYRASGKYKCDNPADCTDIEHVANGESLQGVGNCEVTALDERVLKALVYAIEVGGFSIGTYALCSDHSPGSAHVQGRAVDISSVNGTSINTRNTTTRQNALALAQLLNKMPGDIHPTQLITAGYGPNGDPSNYDDAFLALEIPSSSWYGGKCSGAYSAHGCVNIGHLNHEHLGY